MDSNRSGQSNKNVCNCKHNGGWPYPCKYLCHSAYLFNVNLSHKNIPFDYITLYQLKTFIEILFDLKFKKIVVFLFTFILYKTLRGYEDVTFFKMKWRDDINFIYNYILDTCFCRFCINEKILLNRLWIFVNHFECLFAKFIQKVSTMC